MSNTFPSLRSGATLGCGHTLTVPADTMYLSLRRSRAK